MNGLIKRRVVLITRLFSLVTLSGGLCHSCDFSNSFICNEK